jgi:hypothetical protein
VGKQLSVGLQLAQLLFYWALSLWDYRIGSNFWKFYLTRTGFTLGDPVSLVKVFKLFKLERFFFGVQSVDTVGRCITFYLMAGPACLRALVINLIRASPAASCVQDVTLQKYFSHPTVVFTFLQPHP